MPHTTWFSSGMCPPGTRRRDFALPTKKVPAFAPDGGYLASVDGEEKILLRAIASGAELASPGN